MSKTILYLDPFSGISGDMFVGALLDLGLDLAKLHFELSKLNVAGYHLGAKKVLWSGIAATKFDVTLDAVAGTALASGGAATHEHGHAHGDVGHEHGHSHGDGGGATAHSHHRTFADIRKMIEGSALSAGVKAKSIAAFEKLAVAEGRMHNLPPEAVGFHEVGAIDSIVDMVGACIGLEALGIDEIWSGPIALGSGGFVTCEHGQMPVPAPATLELMKGLPIRETSFAKELTTPTGAALAAALVTHFGPLPPMTISKLGYGAGTREKQPFPNILRVALGTVADAPTKNAETSDTIVELAANIDDATAEVLGHVCEMLLARGALDVFLTPIQMKKFRPGTLLTVLAEPAQLDMLAELIFRESSTFGIRYQTFSRMKLSRRVETVETPYGAVRVKIGQWQGRDVSVHPEYEDCRARAQEQGVALQAVMEAARGTWNVERGT